MLSSQNFWVGVVVGVGATWVYHSKIKGRGRKAA